MSIEGQRFYPGADASSLQILELAAEYRRAADALIAVCRQGSPLSRAPYRLIAIHSIELYLNALLLATGHSSAEVRALQHDMAKRTKLAVQAKLGLRQRTIDHLHLLTTSREYLLARYDPARAKSELNRLGASLADVEKKVTRHVRVATNGLPSKVATAHINASSRRKSPAS